ncbi:MAG: DUF2341 domain-containing protein [Gammaproteobacteria bacterium]
MLAEGADVRFMAGDDITPLKFHFERFDPINQMALAWVKFPLLNAASKNDKGWIYYGNAEAVASQDAAGTYDADMALVYHFDEPGSAKDKTAYGNHTASLTAEYVAASLIGGGLKLSGKPAFSVAPSPSLRFDPEVGMTFSAWVKIDAPQTDSVLLNYGDGVQSIALAIDGTGAYARSTPATGTPIETPRSATITAGAWQHIALIAGKGRLTVLINGIEAASVDAPLVPITGGLNIGGAADGTRVMTGDLDEFQVSRIARDPAWIKAQFRNQGVGSVLPGYGEDESAEDEGGGNASYFAIILHNVTLDGWIVIGLLVVMGGISAYVMIAKGILLKRVRQHNQEFLREYKKLGKDQGRLDSIDASEQDLSLATELFGRHDHFQGSTLYPLYHTGIREVQARVGTAVGAQARGIDAKSIPVIKAALDATLVRENQKLNSQMVLLTIAISGGPFLGLLGTVVGVMITFAAIAATGDVNINAIAPGIAAALVATIAGLAVAIPALFGYNYLGSRIKETNADMQVFLDEFIAKIAEAYGYE